MNKRIRKKKEKELDFFWNQYGGCVATWKGYKSMERRIQSEENWCRFSIPYFYRVPSTEDLF